MEAAQNLPVTTRSLSRSGAQQTGHVLLGSMLASCHGYMSHHAGLRQLDGVVRQSYRPTRDMSVAEPRADAPQAPAPSRVVGRAWVFPPLLLSADSPRPVAVKH